MVDTLLVEDRGPVRILTINRPERRNALDIETVTALADAVIAAGSGGPRAIVLTGFGDHFSAGGDASAILDAVDDPADDANLRLMHAFHSAVLAIWQSAVPVVVAVRGAAFGGSMNVALAGDVIIASETARFCEVFLKRSVIPDLGGAFLLPRIVGLARAKDLILRTREILAPEALELGLVAEVTSEDVLERALVVAAEIAEHSPVAVGLTKKLLNASTGLTMSGSLELEAAYQAFVLDTSAAAEGFAPFRKK